MGMTDRDRRQGEGWDSELHLAGGTHRQTGPTTDEEQLAAWRERRDAHITVHLDEAFNRNVNLVGDPELHELADLVSRVTDGQVSFDHSLEPDATKFYIFHGIEGQHVRPEIVRLLQDILKTPRGL